MLDITKPITLSKGSIEMENDLNRWVNAQLALDPTPITSVVVRTTQATGYTVADLFDLEVNDKGKDSEVVIPDIDSFLAMLKETRKSSTSRNKSLLTRFQTALNDAVARKSLNRRSEIDAKFHTRTFVTLDEVDGRQVIDGGIHSLLETLSHLISMSQSVSLSLNPSSREVVMTDPSVLMVKAVNCDGDWAKVGYIRHHFNESGENVFRFAPVDNYHYSTRRLFREAFDSCEANFTQDLLQQYYALIGIRIASVVDTLERKVAEWNSTIAPLEIINAEVPALVS